MGDILAPTPDDVPERGNDRVTSVAYKLDRGAEVTLSELTTFLESLAPSNNEGLVYYVKKIAQDVAKERKIKLFPILSVDATKVLIIYIQGSEQSNLSDLIDAKNIQLICEFNLENLDGSNSKQKSPVKIRRKIENYFEHQDFGLSKKTRG